MNDAVRKMLATIAHQTAATASTTGRSTLSPTVLAAIEAVNRADFVPDNALNRAYDDGPLAIGYGQTISQPFIVALMTDLLDIEPDHKVLEIGTGSGYQTAILSKLAAEVYTVERIENLAEQARQQFEKLGYDNIHCRQADGYLGWEEHGAYDGIIVTAAAAAVPPALLNQLKSGGRMVIPLAEARGYQDLVLIDKDKEGKAHSQPLLSVSFVPLVAD
ncbi:protein-L-isoaspartate(D-aspartate) O-methyltransferase [uncultured Methylophaga sp.]|uniref:protein-L-isoaspartate(D-aspartate) O-methyltransferase n=1 Tax=uncultured Methylophaga sp. TaxID=285271 RepID=UPI00262DD431|nr:protein-L-isoaspartate(D-aspartate) O-methyltransferase [uncultured Methylophaga sp.]